LLGGKKVHPRRQNPGYAYVFYLGALCMYAYVYMFARATALLCLMVQYN